jgi:hypothetical protein
LQCVKQLHMLFGESTRSLVMCSYADYCCLYRLHLPTTGALEYLLGYGIFLYYCNNVILIRDV